MITNNDYNVDRCATTSGKACCKRFSWSAILAGAFIGLGLSFLLNLFSVAIGLSLVVTSKEGLETLAIGGFIGLLIGTIAAMFTAGFATGYLAKPHCARQNKGALYGFTTWSVALILLVLLSTRMGDFVTHYTNVITHHPTNVAANVAVVNNPVSTDVTVDAQRAINQLGYTASLIFVLFFVGALSSAFGGHLGISCCRKEECRKEEHVKLDKVK